MVIGSMELLLIFATSFFSSGVLGLPLSVPPLPRDPVIERAAPNTCLFHFETAGVATPEASSKNLTEQMLAGEEMREFLGEVGAQVVGLGRQAMKAPPEVTDAVTTLIKAVLARPLALSVEQFTPPTDGNPPKAVASFAIRAGDALGAIDAAIIALTEQARADGGLDGHSQAIEVAGNTFRLFGTPLGPLTWGPIAKGPAAGTYVATIGEGALESVLARLGNANRKTPAWKADLEKRMPLERQSTLTYLNASMALEILLSLPIPDRDRFLAVLDATGIAGIETIGARSGMTAEGIVSSMCLDFDGEPKGLFAKPTAGIGPEKLARVPAGAIMAQAWSLDLSKSLALLLDIVAAGDPQAADDMREGLDRFRAVAGFDFDTHLLKTLGPDWTILSTPAPGAMLPAIAVVAGVRDRPAFATIHKVLLSMLRGVTANTDVRANVREISYRGNTLFCLELIGDEITFPIEPTWCLTDDSLIVTLSPQLMKTLLSRDPDDGGIGASPAVATALAAGKPTFVATTDPAWHFGTLCGFYEFGVPLARGLLAKQGLEFDLPQLPASSAITPFLRPSVTVIRHDSAGILLETTGTMPLIGGGFLGASPSSAPILVALLLPALSAAREAANRSLVANNVKQVLIALVMYEADNGSFPSQAICDKQGNPLLSWRVAILPYLDEQELYEEFNLDEPWDSEHNRELIGRMPMVFVSPLTAADETQNGLTTLQVLSGPGTPFAKPATGIRAADVSDGMSNTLAVVEAVPEAAVPWTKPADIAFDPDVPLSGVGNPRRAGGIFVAGFIDGHVQVIPPDIDPDVFKGLVTPAGGEPVRMP